MKHSIVYLILILILLGISVSVLYMPERECSTNGCFNLVTFDVSELDIGDVSPLNLVFIFDNDKYLGPISCIDTFRQNNYSILGFHSTQVSESNLEFSINPLEMRLSQNQIESNRVYDISSLQVYSVDISCVRGEVIYEDPEFTFLLGSVVYPNGPRCDGRCFRSQFVLG